MSEFAERLKDLRKRHSVSQIDLGKSLSFGPSAISSYETANHEPSYDILIKICDYFSVSVDYILGHDITSVYSTEEVRLLEKYRELNDSDKQIISRILDSLTKSKYTK